MRRTFVLAVCFATAFAFGAAAQDGNREAAERYVKLPSVQKSITDMFGPGLIESMLNVMGVGDLPADKKAKLIEIMREEMASIQPAIEAAMVDAAARTFSLGELEAMIAFYSSPEGEAILVKMQPFTQSYLGIVGPDLQAAQARIVVRIQAEIAQ